MKYLLGLALLFIVPLGVQAMSEDVFLDKLIWCESRGLETATVLDSNNVYSRGHFQFQARTFEWAGKKYGFLPEEMGLNEILLLIYRPTLQRAIAKEMLREGIADDHWKICYKKIYAQKIS